MPIISMCHIHINYNVSGESAQRFNYLLKAREWEFRCPEPKWLIGVDSSQHLTTDLEGRNGGFVGKTVSARCHAMNKIQNIKEEDA